MSLETTSHPSESGEKRSSDDTLETYIHYLLVTRSMMGVMSLYCCCCCGVWGDTEPQTSQYVLGLRSGTGWQHDRAGGCVTGKLTCLAQISTKIIHCTEDSRGHVWYRVRAFWTRVGAIRCNYPGRKHRKVRISFLIIERRIAFTWSPDLGKVSSKYYAREKILKWWTVN